MALATGNRLGRVPGPCGARCGGQGPLCVCTIALHGAIFSFWGPFGAYLGQFLGTRRSKVALKTTPESFQVLAHAPLVIPERCFERVGGYGGKGGIGIVPSTHPPPPQNGTLRRSGGPWPLGQALEAKKWRESKVCLRGTHPCAHFGPGVKTALRGPATVQGPRYF